MPVAMIGMNGITGETVSNPKSSLAQPCWNTSVVTPRVARMESTNPAAADNGVVLGVTGQAAVNIDMADKLADVLPISIVIIVGLSILILLLVFRSILVQVIATAGFV